MIKLILAITWIAVIALLIFLTISACYAWVDRDWFSVGVSCLCFVTVSINLLLVTHSALREMEWRKKYTEFAAASDIEEDGELK